MTFEEYKAKEIPRLRDIIAFFSNNNKQRRELWVAKEFLRILTMDYSSDELEPFSDEPPDIKFREANFEIKELFDEDRRRHREYQVRLRTLLLANSFEDISMRGWDMDEISFQGIIDNINNKLRGIMYSPDVKGRLDLLIYINYKFFALSEDTSFTIPEDALVKEWRSVSMVANNSKACIFYASQNAPEFLQQAQGNFIVQD